MRKFDREDIKKILKEKDSWWTVLIIDPIASKLTLFLASNTSISPNCVSFLSLTLAVLSAFWFYKQQYLIGAIVYEFAFILDCVDGKLAALLDKRTHWGKWLDRLSDKVRLILNSFALGSASNNLELAFFFLALYMWQEIEGYQNWLETGQRSSDISSIDKGLVGRIKEALRKRRMVSFPDLVEQDTLAFFIGPLTGYIRTGFVLAIVLNILRKALLFYKYQLRRPEDHGNSA